MKIIQRTLVALVLAAAPAWAADGIAFITNLKGEVAVDGNPRPALLSELGKGQKISVGRESQASVMYIASGKEYALKGPGEYLLKDTEVAAASGMPPVTRNTEWRPTNKVLVQVAQTSAASVRMRSAAQPKPDVGPKLLFPTEGAVSTLQPTFRWRRDDKDPVEFTLMVVGQEKAVHVVKVNALSYRVPAKLKPDTEYAWVLASGGNEIGMGKFRTLPAEGVQRAERAKPAERAEFSDRVLYALMLHEMGATQEARESWARLAQERSDLPELSALAK
jgi:hypothetical protein